MHHFEARQNDASTPKIFETQHGPSAAFDSPMVLFHDVVHVFWLADPDGRFTIGIDRFERGEIGAAPVDRHGVEFAVLINRFFEIPPGCGLGRSARSRKLTVLPALSTARYKYFHCPLTLMYVSSTASSFRPGACDGETISPVPATA
jgi:hypothetical protein